MHRCREGVAEEAHLAHVPLESLDQIHVIRVNPCRDTHVEFDAFAIRSESASTNPCLPQNPRRPYRWSPRVCSRAPQGICANPAHRRHTPTVDHGVINGLWAWSARAIRVSCGGRDPVANILGWVACSWIGLQHGNAKRTHAPWRVWADSAVPEVGGVVPCHGIDLQGWSDGGGSNAAATFSVTQLSTGHVHQESSPHEENDGLS